MIGGNNMLANFVINTLRRDGQKGEYLYFRVSGILQIQNLMENLITSLVTGTDGDGVVNRNRINQTTMGLLFMYLLDSVQSAESLNPDQYENMIVMSTLDYIDRNYPTAALGELAENLKLPVHTLSRMIKRSAGGNFTELLQRKRLNRAVSLLVETDEPINDIIDKVGYENHSYFHRVFKARYGMTPHAFRKKNQEMKKIRIDGGNVKKM
jgi:AraC-like DNA-binding protein